MENEVSLQKAVGVLREQYGRTYNAGYEDGKQDLERTLEEKLNLTRAEAKATIEALIQGHTIRWASNPDSVPNPASTMGVFTEEATWFL